MRAKLPCMNHFYTFTIWLKFTLLFPNSILKRNQKSLTRLVFLAVPEIVWKWHNDLMHCAIPVSHNSTIQDWNVFNTPTFFRCIFRSSFLIPTLLICLVSSPWPVCDSCLDLFCRGTAECRLACENLRGHHAHGTKPIQQQLYFHKVSRWTSSMSLYLENLFGNATSCPTFLGNIFVMSTMLFDVCKEKVTVRSLKYVDFNHHEDEKDVDPFSMILRPIEEIF